MIQMQGLGISRRNAPWILGQAGLILLLVAVYFLVRGLTEGSTADAVANAHDVLALEQRLGIDVEGALQGPVTESETVVTLANWVYIWGHWPVISVTLLWLALGDRDVFRRLRDAMMISGAVGMVIFAMYPVAPPRLADPGMVDTVTERSTSYRVLQPPAFVNQYAAMPSLHAGWDLLVGIAIVTAASTLALRVFGYAMPILMAVAVIITANHYILDLIAGIALVLVAHFGALALERRRIRLRRERAEEQLPKSQPGRPRLAEEP